MKQNYNSFSYWQNLISENKTIRGHMFMDKTPTKKSLYIHSLIFSKGNGLNNMWSYVPDERALIGYMQYSFLQEAFYTWINYENEKIYYIPSKSVDEIIRDGEKKNRITKIEAENMRRHLEMINSCWALPKNKVLPAIKKFSRDFNKTWHGDNKEFLYLKVFETPEEVGEFVVKSSIASSTEDEFVNRIGEDIESLLDICKTADTNKQNGEKFREILLKKLTEVI